MTRNIKTKLCQKNQGSSGIEENKNKQEFKDKQKDKETKLEKANQLDKSSESSRLDHFVFAKCIVKTSRKQIV